jgi:hypothetical protein
MPFSIYRKSEPLRTGFLPNNIQEFCTSLETEYVYATKPNWLMLFRETVAVYCENHMKHTNILHGQRAEFQYFRTGGTHSNHWDL